MVATRGIDYKDKPRKELQLTKLELEYHKLQIDLSKLVDRWLWDRGDTEGLDRYTIGVVARSFQKLLKRGG